MTQISGAMRPEFVEEAAMDTIKELSDDIFRERILRARAMDPTEKFLLGQRLFESACEVTKSGIRSENPGASEDQIRAILRQRLEWKQRWEEMQCKTKQSRSK